MSTKQTPQATLPKTTMIGLNYWNATTKSSNADFETVLQEPITMKQGDFAQVRNVFLDASKLNNEVISIEEDTLLEMDIMFYAMLKKTQANLGNCNTSKTIPNVSNGWTFGVSDQSDSGGGNVPSPHDQFRTQFVNPLWNYAQIAMAGYFCNFKLQGDVAYNGFDVTKSRWAQSGWNANDFANTANPLETRYNLNMSLPTNTRAFNQPVYLHELNTNKPYIRTVSFTLPKGVYAREELAIKLTKLMAEQTPNQQTIANFTNLPTPQRNNTFEANVQDFGDTEPHNRVSQITPYKTRTDTATNPFQANIRFGYVSNTAKGQPNQLGYKFFSTNQLEPAGGETIPEEAIVDQFSVLMTPDIVGFCDETGLQKTLADKLSVLNKQVCWTPLCNDFRLYDGTAPLPAGDMYDYTQNDSQGKFIINQWDNVFDTQIVANEFFEKPFTQDIVREPPRPSYNCGYVNCMRFHHWISPAGGLNAHDNLWGGTFGTNEISISYNDNNNSKFSFNFLHTPIIQAVDETSGGIPVVVKQVAKYSVDYRSDLTSDAQGYLGGGNATIDHQTSIADRHSGILLTGLRASQKGQAFDFWGNVLGFDLEQVLYKKPEGSFYIYKHIVQGNLVVNETLQSYDYFMKKTTGALYGISFQEDPKLINIGNNNELMHAPDLAAEHTGLTADNDLVFESEQASSIQATSLPSSLLTELGGSILVEITGFATGDLQDGKDSFAVKSIISLYYLSDNSYISSELDPYVVYHTSSVDHVISKLRVRFLNPITKKVIPNTILGNKNSLFLAITQNLPIM